MKILRNSLIAACIAACVGLAIAVTAHAGVRHTDGIRGCPGRYLTGASEGIDIGAQDVRTSTTLSCAGGFNVIHILFRTMVNGANNEQCAGEIAAREACYVAGYRCQEDGHRVDGGIPTQCVDGDRTVAFIYITRSTS